MYNEIKKNLNEEDIEDETVEEENSEAEMELLKERMQEKANNGNAMVKDVIEDQMDEVLNYETPQDFLEHLIDLGITGGGVGSMIYYDDTLNFAESFADELNERLSEKMDEYGTSSLKEFFGDNYDDEDPLNIGQTNRNLFAWWAYEDVCRDLAYELNEEYNYEANI